MFFAKASIYKQIPCLIFVALVTSTCADYTKNTDIQIAQATPSVAENIVFPKNIGVIDVTAPEYGAIPNDGKDDTEAIQKALSRFPGQGRIIYLPNGVYDISNSLHWPPGERNRSNYKYTTLQGQSRDRVIIRLQDQSPLFQDSSKPRPVISTGFDPDLDPNSEDFKASLVAQRFANSVRNLTIKVGKNNPGAEGLNFVANNQGAVRSVKIISEDKKGTTGLALTHGELGPLLIEDVEIVGFDYGVRTNNGINGITIQNLTVREQNFAGIFNNGQAMSLEGFNSINSVSAIINGLDPKKRLDLGGTLTLVNAKLIGRDRAQKLPAISSVGFIYGRNVTSSGYKNILLNKTANKIVKGSSLDEYTSHPSTSQLASPSKSLQLPIKQFPKLKWDNPQKWVSVEKFGAIGEDDKDDTAAFQAAIDSGATTVVIPGGKGTFIIDGSLRLRGKLERFISTGAALNGKGEIVADKGSKSTLIIENFIVRYGSKLMWKNVANRTVVYRSILQLNLESNGTGDLFIDDATMQKLRFLNPAQNIWARQLNPEGSSETNVVNNGAKLWILGLKTEKGKIKIDTTNKGFTEVLGGLIYAAGRQDPKEPLFRIVNASAAFVGVADTYFDKDTYQIWVEETRGSKTKKLTRDKVLDRMAGNGRVLLLYTGFEKLPR
ncbi:glycosyl hydrolase family 28-related protein [Fischerella thermalis]|uniref:glycosyl hydrolase family 28-related protein n=1 Tax=Fischerella thermalis TaxID=372787 RepID=UPI0002DEB0C5|nr:glycosyl hydrolase family 28-related protein [Fischerella thermalis]